MSFNVFLLSILASLIGAAIYAFFLSNREDAIRSCIVRSGKGWIKRRYVRIFIHAVRGEATAADARDLTHILLIYPIMMISVGWSLYYSHQSATEDVDQIIVRVENLKADEDATPDTPESIEKELHQARTQLDFRYPQIVTFLIFGHLWFFWMVFIRQPFVVFRRRFAHELNRFLLRIQGLASKNELAELAQLEAKVQDQQSATEYVNKMASIARRYNVEHLVDTFLLWGEPAAENDA